jgi:hypothetical protein
VSAAGALVASAFEGFVTVVERSAPALPFVGPALLALTLVDRQALVARANTAARKSSTRTR